MPVIDYLSGLRVENLPPICHFRLDEFQEKVQHNTYLELPQTDGSFCLLRPDLSPMGGHPVEERLAVFTGHRRDLLIYLKERLLRALILDTAILESSASYFVEQNGHVLLARFKEFRSEENILEIKLYTATEADLVKRYSDKIYIGRCFLRMEEPDLPYGGLNLFVLSLMDQYDILRSKAEGRLKDPVRYEDTYFLETRELIADVVAEVIRVLDTLPAELTPESWDVAECMRVKSGYRCITNRFVELVEEISEFENVLRYSGEDAFARYVTKYRQDVRNLIDFLFLNILSPLAFRLRKQD